MTSRLTAGTAAASAPAGAGVIAASACKSVPKATCEPTIDPADVPTITSANDRSTPARRRPMTIPASQATPAMPPPPSTTPRVIRPVCPEQAPRHGNRRVMGDLTPLREALPATAGRPPMVWWVQEVPGQFHDDGELPRRAAPCGIAGPDGFAFLRPGRRGQYSAPN